MKRFHYDKETGWGYLIKNNDIDGKPTIKIAFKVEEETSTKFEKIPSGAFAQRIYRQQYDDSLI
jgi:hypothetical protein